MAVFLDHRSNFYKFPIFYFEISTYLLRDLDNAFSVAHDTAPYGKLKEENNLGELEQYALRHPVVFKHEVP